MYAVSNNLPGVAETNQEKVSPLQIAGFIKDFGPVTNFKNIP
jgi:hypothetical protein